MTHKTPTTISLFSIHNCLVMAREEMDVLKQLDTLTIQKMVNTFA